MNERSVLLIIIVLIIILVLLLCRLNKQYFFTDILLDKLKQNKIKNPLTSSEQIPRILVQTHNYDRFDDVQIENKKIMQNLRDTNPNWDYRYYNDTDSRNFIKYSMPGRVLDAYDSINPLYGPAQADLFRYIAIYVHGGVYLDCKSDTSIPLDDIFQYKESLFLAQWSSIAPWSETVGMKGGEFINWAIAAPKNDPILYHVIMYIVENIEKESKKPIEDHQTGKKGVLKLTGPIAFSLGVGDYMEKNKYPLIVYPSAKELGLNYISPLNDNNKSKKHYDEQQVTHYSKLTEPIIFENSPDHITDRPER
jgi:hypothetical protein